MPPPFGADSIRRSQSMPDFGAQFNLDNLNGPGNLNNQVQVDNPGNVENQGNLENQGNVNGQQGVQPDHAIENVQNNNVGPDIQPGDGQARNFVANHEVTSAHDWDAPMGALYSALPGLILGIVKESAIAAVKKWLENPENVVKLILFVIDHLDDALELAINAVEWVVEHPEATLQIAASIAGTSSLGEASRNKVVQWTCVNGEFESVTVSMQRANKIGVNVDPVGVGLGLGFDLSYSVTEKYKEMEYAPRRPLLSFLAKAEEFIIGNAKIGNGVEGFKNWLAKNLRGVENVLNSLKDPAKAATQAKIYADALERVIDNDDLRNDLQEAWRAATTLPADAEPDRMVNVAYKLFVSLVHAYKYSPELAAA